MGESPLPDIRKGTSIDLAPEDGIYQLYVSLAARTLDLARLLVHGHVSLTYLHHALQIGHGLGGIAPSRIHHRRAPLCGSKMGCMTDAELLSGE